MSRTLALTKKIDLSDVAEGWAGAYVKFSPMLAKDMSALAKNKDINEEQDTEALTEQMLTTLKAKFIEGKVAIENGDGVELVAMEKDDIDSLPFDTLSKSFALVIGTDFDPKAIERAQVNAPKPTQDVPPTVTQS